MEIDQVSQLSDQALMDTLSVHTERITRLRDVQGFNCNNGIMMVEKTGRLISAVREEILRRMRYRTSSALVIK